MSNGTNVTALAVSTEAFSGCADLDGILVLAFGYGLLGLLLPAAPFIAETDAKRGSCTPMAGILLLFMVFVANAIYMRWVQATIMAYYSDPFVLMFVPLAMAVSLIAATSSKRILPFALLIGLVVLFINGLATTPLLITLAAVVVFLFVLSRIEYIYTRVWRYTYSFGFYITYAVLGISYYADDDTGCGHKRNHLLVCYQQCPVVTVDTRPSFAVFASVLSVGLAACLGGLFFHYWYRKRYGGGPVDAEQRKKDRKAKHRRLKQRSESESDKKPLQANGGPTKASDTFSGDEDSDDDDDGNGIYSIGNIEDDEDETARQSAIILEQKEKQQRIAASPVTVAGRMASAIHLQQPRLWSPA